MTNMLSLQRQEGGSHYQNNGPQPIELIMLIDPSYAMCNVFKYLARYKKKAGLLDLKKAMHYIDFAIELDTSFTRRFDMTSFESWIANQTIPPDEDIVQCLRAVFSRDYNIAKKLLSLIIEKYKQEVIRTLQSASFNDTFVLKPIVTDASRYYVSKTYDTNCLVTNARTGEIESFNYDTLLDSYIIETK